MIKAINFKTWCEENITPQCWPRILLKSVPELRERGIALHDLENPDDSIELDSDVVSILNKALNEIYQMQVEEGMLA